MKVVLIYAKSQAIRELAGELWSDETKLKGEMARDEIYPPLGITILASYLEEAGHTVKLFDDSIAMLDDIKDAMRWSDMVGISSLTPNARRARELGQISKQEIGRFTVLAKSRDCLIPAMTTHAMVGRVNSGSITEMVFHAIRVLENGQSSKVP